MIYLVSRNKRLFSPEYYTQVSFKEAMAVLEPLVLVQLDTETEGLDCHTKRLLTIQLGNKENQVVFDWTTLSSSEKEALKEYLESERTFLGWNLSFDLTFLYVQNIYPKHIIDGMILEKVIFLGFPPILNTDLYDGQFGYQQVLDEKGQLKYWEISYSLKAATQRWCNVDIDKTVRGKIIDQGLTEEVIVYAAGDVMWIEDIYKEQCKELDKQNLRKAAEFECESVKPVAYTKYCGIHLSPERWDAKMARDQKELDESLQDLNDYVVSLYNENPEVYKKFVQYVQPDLFGYVKPGYSCIINWGSSKQVIPLFEILGINVNTFDKKTKKEKKSIEEKQIAPQADKFPIIPLFLRYQGASKLVSTYGENWKKAINPKTGRIHVEIHSIGTDTARMSSGGGVWKLNLQNLPHDKITRACFTAEEGNVWISSDYQSQESRLIASVSADKAMIDLFETGCGDVHSLVAYMSYPSIIPRDTRIEDIKELYHEQRQDAKGIEFAVNYGGDAHTIAANKGLPIKEAEKIYSDFMKGFPGIYRYQQYCRREVMNKGYILMNPVLGHRAHIYDAEWQKRMSNKMSDRDFTSYYWEMKKTAPYCDTVQDVKKFNNRKAASEKQSINYRIQNRGACCTKLALIKFFNWIVSHNYQDIVKICAIVHDEINVECPESMKEEVSDILVKCMVAGGKPFCPNVFLGADVSIGDHWIH